MKPDEIEIHTDAAFGRPYQVIGSIEARVTSGAAWNKARTLEDVNSKLREVAVKLGASAVLNVTYQRGVSATSWKALTARGTAVVAESTERKCPYSAEMIKAEARVCRFCGRDIEPAQTASSTLDAVRDRYPAVYDMALEQLECLPQAPTEPAAWLSELCRRMEAGSPPELAAARIPLDIAF